MIMTKSFSPGSVVTVKLSNGRELIATYHGQNDNHIMLSTIYRLDEKAEAFFPYIKTLPQDDSVMMCNIDQVFTVHFPDNQIQANYLQLKLNQQAKREKKKEEQAENKETND